MRFLIATIAAFSSVFLGTVAAKAQEIPDTFLAVSPSFKERGGQSSNYVNQHAGGLYINRIPNCTLLGQQIYPCE